MTNGPPTFVTPEVLIVTSVIFVISSVLAVSLRFTTRYLQRVSYGVDDWLVVPSALLVVGMCINLLIAVDRKAMGVAEDVTFSYKTAMSGYINEILSPLQLGLIKLSIIFFLRRIFCIGNRDVFYYLTSGLATIIALWTTAMTFAFLFQCGTDFSRVSGDPFVYLHSCSQQTTDQAAFCFSDAVIDVLVLLLPLPNIWKLHLDLSKKIYLTLIFTVGCLAVVASLVRLAMTVELIRNADGGLVSQGQAIVATISTGYFFSLFEGGISVIVACLPTLQFLFIMAGSRLGLGNLRSKRSGFRSIEERKPENGRSRGISMGDRTGRGRITVKNDFTVVSQAGAASEGCGDVEIT